MAETTHTHDVYPHVLPPAADLEPVSEILSRTGERSSLAEGYEAGHAPAAQLRQGQVTPGRPDYYGLPAIKKPEWKWYIPAYFVTGGMAAGSYITAALADAAGHPEDRSLVRAGRYLSIVMLGASPVFLIADLGRPERFHHMLRVFRPRSMMNQGAWGLTVFGAFAGLAALSQLVEDLRRPRPRPVSSGLPIPSSPSPMRNLGRAAGIAGIIPAAYIGSYTGVLLSSTCVPLWARNPRWLGPLFFASALGGGIAGTHLTARMLGPVSEATSERVRSADDLCTAAEVALTAASVVSLGKLAKPLVQGKMSNAFKLGYLGLGLAAPLVLSRLAKKRPWLGVLASALSVAGTVFLKTAMTEAGKESADDPQAYFEYTKAEEQP
jgi:formate-dependent nitrite reductase membrane component NrfD